MQTRESIHDVVVIGSGAGGGTVVHTLTKLGVKVLLLEAGGPLNPAKDFKEHLMPWQVPHRGAGEDGRYYFGGMKYGFFEAPNGYWDIPGEPYTVAPDSKFQWFRSRIIGGRTNHFGRISLRFSDYDFKPRSTDGLGDDWPISYEDVAPYYDKAEAFIGVHGTREGLRTAPDGIFMKPPAPRVHEVLIQKSCKKLGIPVIPVRKAMITRALNGRAACHYCGHCGRGCLTASAYSSSQVQIFPAMKTGRLEIRTNAMVRALETKNGRVDSVVYIDKTTREERRVRARVVVLAASACESARLLLNSGNLANGSGMVGRNLTDTVGLSVRGQIPALEGLPRHDTDGIRGMHMYIPWWLFGEKLDFPRGYHVEMGGGFGQPHVGTFHGTASRYQSYGKALKRQIRENYGASIGFTGRGEMIPNAKSYCEIDPNVVDEYGIPVLRFHFQWSEHERKQAAHMKKTFTEIITNLGGRPETISAGEITTGGEVIHEVGTIRMGDDPRTSALNKYQQAHEVKNLFVADAAPFVSNPDKNPTLSIIALAWRMSEYLAEEMRKDNV
ncbi:MAG: GMC family oxidoreductase [Acidobacteria bacterium]|nr:GMC family oxidoreductase [Acidobacteriota bacterium]